MSTDPLEASEWDDAVSANPIAAKTTVLEAPVVDELSKTLQSTDINIYKEQPTEDEEVPEKKSKQEEEQQTEDRPPDEDQKHKEELLSTLTKDDKTGASPFTTPISPKKDESLFKDTTKGLHLPDAGEVEEKEPSKTSSSSTGSGPLSPSKVRRQNVYKAPRLRRHPIKQTADEVIASDSEVKSEPLGPLGGPQGDEASSADNETPAEKLLRQADAPLFEINRTPLSPLKQKTNNIKPISKDTPPKDEQQLKLQQERIQKRAKELENPAIKLDISVGDPIKVGELTGAHIVYSVRTRTDSELFQSEQTVVSRRYRDFRWLHRQLQATHPGRIIPPPPDKQAVGRFNEDFIEGRRLALERMLIKISQSVHLQKDPDFIMFLQSERFTSNAREREKAVAANSIFTEVETDGSLNNNSGGFLSSIGGAFSFTPKIVELDPYFKDKKSYVEALDQQFKLFLRNLETIVVQRNDLAIVTEEFANITSVLADLEISKTSTDLFSEFSNTQLRIKDLLDRLSLQDMLTLGSTLDEYQRVISSIRTTFQQRDKILLSLSNTDAELRKRIASYDKALKYNRTQTDKINALKAEVTAVEQKQQTITEKFDNVSSTIKEELETFEIDRIHDFRNSIEIFLESTIESQKEAVELWETFYTTHLSSVVK